MSEPTVEQRLINKIDRYDSIADVYNIAVTKANDAKTAARVSPKSLLSFGFSKTATSPTQLNDNVISLKTQMESAKVEAEEAKTKLLELYKIYPRLAIYRNGKITWRIKNDETVGKFQTTLDSDAIVKQAFDTDIVKDELIKVKQEEAEHDKGEPHNISSGGRGTRRKSKYNKIKRYRRKSRRYKKSNRRRTRCKY